MKLQNAVLGMVAAVGIAGLAAAPSPATASITLQGGVVDPIPVLGLDNFLQTGFGMSGFQAVPIEGYGVYGGQLSGPAGRYQIDIYGAEAAFANTFEWNDGSGWATLYTHPGGTTFLNGVPSTLYAPAPLAPVPLLTLFVSNPADGTLPFRFGIGSVTPPVNFVTNGSNPDDPNRPSGPGGAQIANFVLFTNPATRLQPGRSQSWFVNLDDGNAVDDDDDDLSIRITKVPTPGALAVFGIALAGLGLARRRRGAATA